jgi:hypothetical protein
MDAKIIRNIVVVSFQVILLGHFSALSQTGKVYTQPLDPIGGL